LRKKELSFGVDFRNRERKKNRKEKNEENLAKLFLSLSLSL